MHKCVNFSLCSFDFVEESKKSLFQKVRIKAFSSGENSNTLPVDEDVLINGAKTIYDNPILWKYNKYTDDANGHDADEVPCGFIKEEESNPVTFERIEDGRLFICIDALIWTKYSGRLLEIFKRDGGRKNVSIEMIVEKENVTNSPKPKIKDFVIAGITILGEYISPACKGSVAEIIGFSEKEFNRDKEEYIKIHNGISINNKEPIIGIWRNPRRKLFSNLIRSKNQEDLLNESYLLVKNNENVNISDCLFPHHIYKNGEILLHANGLISSANMAYKNGNMNDEIKSHIMRHINDLGMNKDNFKEFNISEEQYRTFSENIIEESVGVKKMKHEDETKKENEIVYDEKEQKDEKEITVEDDENIEKKEDNIKNDEKDIEFSKMKDDMEKMEKTIQELNDKISEMSDYEELKKFKEEIMEEKQKEENMKQMQKIICEIEDKGFSIKDSEKESLCSEIEKFDSIDAWGNFVKSQVFDKIEFSDGVVRIDTLDNKEKKSSSVWDRL